MFLLISRLERLDLVVEFYREANVIEAIQEAVFVEGVDLKTVRRLIRTRNTLGIEIDGDFRTRAFPQLLAQFRTHLLRQPNGQDTVLDAVIVVDIGDAGRDTERSPFVSRAVTAFSRDDPHPQLTSATKMRPSRYGGELYTKSFSEPSSLKRKSWNRNREYSGSFLPRRRNRAGIIWSVSQLAMSIGTATDANVLNGSMTTSPP